MALSAPRPGGAGATGTSYALAAGGLVVAGLGLGGLARTRRRPGARRHGALAPGRPQLTRPGRHRHGSRHRQPSTSAVARQPLRAPGRAVSRRRAAVGETAVSGFAPRCLAACSGLPPWRWMPSRGRAGASTLSPARSRGRAAAAVCSAPGGLRSAAPRQPAVALTVATTATLNLPSASAARNTITIAEAGEEADLLKQRPGGPADRRRRRSEGSIQCPATRLPTANQAPASAASHAPMQRRRAEPARAARRGRRPA